jgi:hypothetical protein
MSSSPCACSPAALSPTKQGNEFDFAAFTSRVLKGLTHMLIKSGIVCVCVTNVKRPDSSDMFWSVQTLMFQTIWSLCCWGVAESNRASEAVGIATWSNSTWSAFSRCWPEATGATVATVAYLSISHSVLLLGKSTLLQSLDSSLCNKM